VDIVGGVQEESTSPQEEEKGSIRTKACPPRLSKQKKNPQLPRLLSIDEGRPANMTSEIRASFCLVGKGVNSGAEKGAWGRVWWGTLHS